ncbi:glycosyltransferase [Dyella silvatica]|uniref:glycosyltransferase n=1 Tax=Dyella silvatica TaxID=2992128 RepID=UPI003CCD5721
MSGPTIAIFTIGTQGDIRPCVALGIGLKKAGYAVRIVTSDNFAEMIRSAGLEFFPLTSNFQTLLENDRGLVDEGLDMHSIAAADTFENLAADRVRRFQAQVVAGLEHGRLSTAAVAGVVGDEAVHQRHRASAPGLAQIPLVRPLFQ